MKKPAKAAPAGHHDHEHCVEDAIAAARDDLHHLVRSHLLAGDDPDALLSFADTAHGRDDFEVWERIARVLPASSPRFAQVVDHLERLDAELR